MPKINVNCGIVALVQVWPLLSSQMLSGFKACDGHRVRHGVCRIGDGLSEMILSSLVIVWAS